MNKQRFIITGANGFIGSNLIKKLLKNPNYAIIALDIKENSLLSKDIQQIVGDFSNIKLLNNILKKDDIIIHLACPTVPATSEKHLDIDINTNILGSIRLMRSAVEKKCKRFIFFSSGGTIYGDQGKAPIKEDTCPKPQNLHGVMKFTIENYLRAYNKLYNLDYLIVRPSNPYGFSEKRNKNQGIIDVFLKKIKNNEELNIWGKGDIIRDYIHINDLVEYADLLLKNNINNETINIGTGIGTSINEILDILKNITEKELNIKYLAKRDFDLKYNVLNVTKAKNLLAWQSKTSLEEGIKKLYNKTKKHG